MAAGCIIYIKQMDETEDELDNFKILRRIGFTYTDMSKGLLLKIAFNFGLPLLIAFITCIICSTCIYETSRKCLNVTYIYSNDYIYSCLFHFAMISFIHSSRMIKHSI